MTNQFNDTGFKLWDLYDEIGASKFGYLAQALFAICLFRLGAKDIIVRSSGHPDVGTRYDGYSWKIEVEIINRKKQTYVLKNDDVSAISPSSALQKGALALLDMHIPLSWRVIMHDKLDKAGTEYSLLAIRRISERELSTELNIELIKILRDYYQVIERNGYPGLVHALKTQNSSILFEEE